MRCSLRCFKGVIYGSRKGNIIGVIEGIRGVQTIAHLNPNPTELYGMHFLVFIPGLEVEEHGGALLIGSCGWSIRV